MIAISVEGVSKRWGKHAALRDIGFQVEQGSLTVLLGPSGCGKSTTLRLIAGLESADTGCIRIGGRDVTHAMPSERDIAMVFQSYALFPHLTVAENIVFGLRVRGVTASERTRQLRDVAELLGLSELLERKPSQLSGGQQQRVALGRAIIARKPICLMDEPLSNLDAQLRGDMRREIRSLQQKLGITMVYVTHDQTEAMTMADQVVVMREGQIEQDVDPVGMYARPASMFVARFIGTPPMNLIDPSRVPNVVVPALSSSEGSVVIGVRPEDVRVNGSGGMRARIDSIEYLGADSILNCAIGETKVLARVQGHSSAEAGTEIALSWAPEAVHLFDAATGRRTQS